MESLLGGRSMPCQGVVDGDFSGAQFNWHNRASRQTLDTRWRTPVAFGKSLTSRGGAPKRTRDMRPFQALDCLAPMKTSVRPRDLVA